MVYGTYYNTAGVVVAVGLVELESPLAPNSSADFTLSELDEAANLATKISSYTLLVQTSTQVFSLPSASPSDTPQALDPSLLTIGIVIIGLIVVIAVVLWVRFRLKRTH